MLTTWIQAVYQFLWGDLLRIPLPGGSSFGVSLLIILLIPTGIYFTIRTRFLPVRLFGDMVRALTGKKKEDGSLSTFQTLIVSTATRVGMGNLVGVVAAVSAGGAGAVSGCGSQRSSVLQLRLSRQHLHSFIKKKIRFTEATAEVRHIICIIM